MNYKPADFCGERTVKLGIVGLPDEVEAARMWIEGFSAFRPAHEKNSSRYRRWPGLSNALGANFSIDQRHIRKIDKSLYGKFWATTRSGDGFQRLVDLFSEKIGGLFGDEGPDCVVVCIPAELGDLRAANPALTPEEKRALEVLRQEEESDQLALFQPTPEELKEAEALYTMADDLLFRTFYRALKAKVMMLDNAVPIQVLRRNTIERGDDQGQSHATRIWNIATSIYYKAKGIPWRPHDLPSNVCFVGITFHHMKKRGGHLVYASVAQAFSTEVEPFSLKGENINHEQRRDRQPYLNEDQSRTLLDQVLSEYENRAGVMPDRVVVHKTTVFQEEEMSGFGEAARECVPRLDMIWLRSTPFRIVRKGKEEPWRGTFCTFDDKYYLFTSGYVPWWQEYPGAHIPAPIEMGSAIPTDMEERAREILALTKMNWNSSDGIGSLPITLLFARRVGELMTEFDQDDTPNSSYRFYV
ncbi:hypothetical protein QMT40_002094 [Parvibaculaceae bacterium PLY_AMNH_Bact1]|nr:hypothetical protein QMT40_002094 [Parvibaculaceae bacterium PLY_AMNH_Bact1]